MAQQQAAENIAIVRKFYDYLSQGDSDTAFDELVSDDCTLYEAEILPYGGVHAGKTVMRAAMDDLMGYFDNFEYTVVNYLGGGDEVVVHLNISGVGRRGRKPFAIPVMELWRIENRKIVEIRPFYFDSAAVASALAE